MLLQLGKSGMVTPSSSGESCSDYRPGAPPKDREQFKKLKGWGRTDRQRKVDAAYVTNGPGYKQEEKSLDKTSSTLCQIWLLQNGENSDQTTAK